MPARRNANGETLRLPSFIGELLHVEWEPEDRAKGEPDHNVSLNTALLAIVAVIGLAILYHVTRLPAGDPYAKCQRIIGMDGACEAEVAASRMMRGRF